MAHRAANGWIAPLPEGLDYTVEETPRRIKKKRTHRPTGVFVQGGAHVGVFINCAGLEDNLFDAFEIPPDAEFVRDVASALRKIAREIEKQRFPKKRSS